MIVSFWRALITTKTAFLIPGLGLLILLSSNRGSGIVSPGNENGFLQIFNGKTLDGWKGDPAYWKVEEGCMVGIVTPETILKRNTFIIWQGEMPENFEIRVEYSVSNKGNSGINYRSEPVEGLPYALRGYQADLNGLNTFTGSNYEERRRTTLASQGQKTELLPLKNPMDSVQAYIIDNQWQRKIITGSLGNPDSLRTHIKTDGWNAYHIIVRGNHMQHYINDILMSDVTDNDTVNRRFKGLLGVQVHVGPPMRIAYRNFLLKKLD